DLGRPRPSAMPQPLRTTSPGHEPASSAEPQLRAGAAQRRYIRWSRPLRSVAPHQLAPPLPKRLSQTPLRLAAHPGLCGTLARAERGPQCWQGMFSSIHHEGGAREHAAGVTPAPGARRARKPGPIAPTRDGGATPSRKTERGLPRYLDEAESDVFLLSGTEDLVPTRHPDTGEIEEFDRSEGEVQYVARQYRPRVEGLFARIERWKRVSGELRGDLHWRVTTRDNVTHIYGQSAGARIADPSFPSQGAKARIFTWLLEETREDKGNIVRYEYKAEDGAGVELKQPSEASRFERQGGSYVFTATAQKYLKRVLYGNKEPFEAADFLFELVFDYGEHDEQATPEEVRDWGVRQDPFSTYRPGFEVRTYRLCRRALMFHRLNAQRDPLLVRSVKFRYEPSPVVTYLVGVTQVGHLFD